MKEGKGRIFKRKDGKFIIYIPVYMGTDSAFPFNEWEDSETGT
jgi:hypothetical protein